MNRLWGHFYTITSHKIKVAGLCFRCGLYKQGILHDLSKYSPIEFISGVRYYQGHRSPISKEKEVLGYSKGWLHHKGRNRHHWEYWVDFFRQGMYAVEMPVNFNIEMVCDRIAASKTYLKESYTDSSPLQYFEGEQGRIAMHPKTVERTYYLLNYLKNHGEDALIQHIRKDILSKRIDF